MPCKKVGSRASRVDGMNYPTRGGSSRMKRELCGLQGDNMDGMKSRGGMKEQRTT